MSLQRVCALSDVPRDGALRIELADMDVAVIRLDDELYALEDRCSHAEVALTDGDVEVIDGVPTIECALHGSCFDLRTGAPTNLPATEPVTVYQVRRAGGDVLIDVDVTAAAATH